MLARLILVLLLALGATPVAAMPAGCRDMAAMTSTHAPAHEHTASADHGCIGCAAVGDWLAERVRSPQVLGTVRPSARAVAFAALAEGPPRLPPPRIG